MVEEKSKTTKKRGRPRKYNAKIRCPECGSNWVVSNGSSRGKKKMLCKECGRQFLINSTRKKLPEEKKKLALILYSKGTKLSVIAEALGVKLNTVYMWIKRYNKDNMK